MIRIASVSRNAVADRVVVHDLALCVGSAHSRARVDAFKHRTRLVVRTVVVASALGTTADDWVALVARVAAAHRHSGVVATLGVGSAR